MFTQVAIVGAVGPAGLTLAHQLHRAGIDSVVLETRSRDYVERRLRAGVLEHATTELLREIGVGEWSLAEGPLLEKGITPMRGVVTEPMQYGRLYLAGDAARTSSRPPAPRA